MNYLINIACAVYRIDPAEINFPNTYKESICNDELTKIYIMTD